jgi:hypothetical protein
VGKLINLEKYVALLLVFFLPTQLALHFWPSWSYVFGIRIDLLAPAVYLTDILGLLLIALDLYINHNFFYRFLVRYKFYLTLLACFIVINIISSVSVSVSIYKWIKILEFIGIVAVFSNNKFIKIYEVASMFFYSLVFFSIIGIAQFITGSTIGGLLYSLGERSFNLNTPGIALVNLGGVDYLRAYSTFSHPNSLAGFLGASCIFIFLNRIRSKSKFNLLGIFVIFLCFFLTFSLSACLGIGVVTMFYLAFYRINAQGSNYLRYSVIGFLFLAVCISLLLPLVSPELFKIFPNTLTHVTERLDLAFIAGQVITKRFWVGSGLGTFIVNIPGYKGIMSYSWLLQPVHNIFLLAFAETGIFGLLAFCFLIYKLLTKIIYKPYVLIFLFILFTGLLDHYSITLQQNFLLLSIITGISINIKT